MGKLKSNILLPYLTCTFIFLFTYCDIPKKQALQQVADRMNEFAPQRMDEYTILLNAEVVDNSTIRYNYRLIDNVEAIANPQNKRRISNTLLYNLSQGEDGKIVREIEATVIYSYTDNENKEVMELKFSPKEYLNFKFDQSHLLQELQDRVNGEQNVLPMVVNEKLIVQSMTILNNNTLVTTYILQGLTNEEIEKVNDAVKTTSLQDVKMNPAMTLLRAMNSSFRYVYKDGEGKELFTVDIAPNDYQ